MLKKKQTPTKKALKKASLKNDSKKKAVKTKPSLVKKTSLIVEGKKRVAQKLVSPEMQEVNDDKEWRKKKRDYWRSRFGQILANLPRKGKEKKQVL